MIPLPSLTGERSREHSRLAKASVENIIILIMKPFGPLNLFQYFIFLLRVRSISKARLDTYSRPSAAAANGIICRPGGLKFLSFGGKPQSDSEFRTEEILI